MRRHKMVNMILVAANKTGGPIERVRIKVGGEQLVNLPDLAAGEHSMPALYNGPVGCHTWRVWLVDEDGKRRRGSARCSITHADNNRCALLTIHLHDFIISKGRYLAGL